MAVQQSLNHVSFETRNGYAPKKGPRSMSVGIDFSILNPYAFDLQLMVENDRLEWIQSVFIDNSANPAAFSLKCLISNQTIVCPAYSQGYFPLLSPSAGFVASTTGNTLIIPLKFLNFPVPACVWGANPTGAGETVTIIGSQGVAGDTTITVGATAQNLFGGVKPAHGFAVYNPDISEDLWVSDTVTAAPNGTGSIRVQANGGGYETPPGYLPVGVVSIYAVSTGHKITARSW